jgi:hypothetical protein
MGAEEQFIDALKGLEGVQQPVQDAFVEQQKSKARLAGRAAVRAWVTGDEKLAEQAFSFLVDLDELSIQPLLEGPLPDNPMNIAMAMRVLVARESTIRKRVVERLEQWLDDKRLVPQPRLPPGTEEQVGEHRVCDEAYVAMRRVVHFSDDDVKQLVDENVLYNLPDALRDEQILKARATRSWRIVLDPDSVDDPP